MTVPTWFPDILKVSPGDLECANSVLRTISEPVVLGDERLPKMVEAMRNVLQAIPYGAGLAAIQIGIPIRLALINIQRTPTSEILLINPVLESITGRSTLRMEGCLSLPNYKGPVKRKDKLIVRSLNISGDQIIIRSFGYEAAVIQHELDHMNGLFYWDRMLNGQAPAAI